MSTLGTWDERTGALEEPPNTFFSTDRTFAQPKLADSSNVTVVDKTTPGRPPEPERNLSPEEVREIISERFGKDLGDILARVAQGAELTGNAAASVLSRLQRMESDPTLWSSRPDDEVKADLATLVGTTFGAGAIRSTFRNPVAGELGAFGGSGPGGRITAADVQKLAKQLDNVRARVRRSPKRQTDYVDLKQWEGPQTPEGGHSRRMVVRVPTDRRSHPGRRYPDDNRVTIDTTDAPKNFDKTIATNRAGERYNDINTVRDALAHYFQRPSQFRLTDPGRAPRPIPQARVTDPPQAPDPRQLSWDDVLEPPK